MADFYASIECRLIKRSGEFSAAERLLSATPDSSEVHLLTAWDTPRIGIAAPKKFTSPILAVRKFGPDQTVFKIWPSSGTLLPGVRETRIGDIVSSTHSIHSRMMLENNELVLVREHFLRVELPRNRNIRGSDDESLEHAYKINTMLTQSGTLRSEFAVRHIQRFRKTLIDVYVANDMDRVLATFVLKSNGLTPIQTNG